MQFRPMPVLTVLAIPSLLLLLALGQWQVERMEWKRDLIARMEAGLAAAPVPVAEALAAIADGEDASYRKVLVEPLPASPDFQEFGRPQRTFRLAAAGEGLILLETAIDAPPEGVTADAPTAPVEALLRPAAKANSFTPENDTAEPFWYWLDAPAMAASITDPAWRAAHGARPVEANWYAAALTLCDYRPTAPVTKPGAPCQPVPNPRADPTARTLSPERHLGYVITWWGLAAALVAVYVALHARAGRLSFR